MACQGDGSSGLRPEVPDSNIGHCLDAPIGSNEAPPKGNPVLINKKNRIPYVNLFKNNRMAHINHKLEFVDTGDEQLYFGEEVFDSVEDTFGICLLGFVVNGRPPTAAIFDLVRRWGSNIHFQTHESGWITFTFPSVEVKERILRGGTHMVFGYHLFLKEMPRFFTFKEEDMRTLPSWVQVHGLPPVGWNFHVLSRVVSKIGTPIHMDMLTHDRQRVQYARVFVEMDSTKPQTKGIQIGTPLGKLDITFVYEKDAKMCQLCHRICHASEDCLVGIRKSNEQPASKGVDEQQRGRSRSVIWRREGPRGRTTFTSTSRHASSRTRKIVKSHTAPVSPIRQCNNDVPTADKALGNGTKDDKGKKVASTVTVEVESTSTLKENEGYTPVTNTSNKKKNKKNKKKKAQNNSTGNNESLKKFLPGMEDTSSCDTKYIHKGLENTKERFFGNEGKGRQPKIVFGKQ